MLLRKRGNIQRFHKGIAPFIPAVAGGLLSAAGTFFGGRKKGGVAFQPTVSLQGSLKGVREGRLLSERLMERARGLGGVGFRPEAISGATGAFATGARKAFEETTAPFISAQASSRGLGKSTVALNRLAIERGGVERNITQRASDLALASEQQRSQDIENALRQLGRFAEAEAMVRERKARFELDVFKSRPSPTQRPNLASALLGAAGGGLTGFASTLPARQDIDLITKVLKGRGPNIVTV